VVLETRTYGDPDAPRVVVLHGGPGAPGYMAPVARELSDRYRVLEPLERPSGGEPLSVALHIADLHETLAAHEALSAPLIGSSWGAMLALAYAAEHASGPLALLGCGTFDPAARARMVELREAATSEALRARLAELDSIEDLDARLLAKAEAILPRDSYELLSTDQELVRCDARGNRESWSDMVRLQREGFYPAAFARIEAPVLMLHGDTDPHPGAMIRDGLLAHVPQLEYVEFERCGHYLWLERHARESFFARLRAWLKDHALQPREEELGAPSLHSELP
jgi:pimeloyl-ACP methyl ester carboxylesterase